MVNILSWRSGILVYLYIGCGHLTLNISYYASRITHNPLLITVLSELSKRLILLIQKMF